MTNDKIFADNFILLLVYVIAFYHDAICPERWVIVIQQFGELY